MQKAPCIDSGPQNLTVGHYRRFMNKKKRIPKYEYWRNLESRFTPSTRTLVVAANDYLVAAVLDRDRMENLDTTGLGGMAEAARRRIHAYMIMGGENGFHDCGKKKGTAHILRYISMYITL